ncbi:MAG: hypothetical protein IT293_04855 [Deltaproteobacteria bacterium]|nr:hypothetical protein [Deltaproteobacteria bacterium]
MTRVLAALALAATLLVPPTARAGDAELIARALPRLVHRGGPFLAHTRIVTVTFAADDAALVRHLARFGDVITRSGWWRTVTEGLCAANGECMGTGRPGRHVVLADDLSAELHATALAALLERAIAAGTLGALDDDTLVLVYLPAGVALRDAFVPRYCGGGPRGFHRALRLPAQTLPYAVVPRCGDAADLTATASHEILEAATNPDPSRRGFAFDGGSTTAGFTAAGVEPVDPCGLLTRAGHRTTADGFVVQRAWSNRAAARGIDPCVPDRSDRPFHALVPAQPTIRLRRPGERATVVVTAAASQPTAPWDVAAIDLTGEQRGARYLDVSLDRTRAAAADVLTLTIVARAVPPGELAVVGLVSRDGTTRDLWPLAVVMR